MSRPMENTAVEAAYRVETATKAEAVERLGADWDRLSRATSRPNVFATFDWYQSWMPHFVEQAGETRLQPHVLAIKRGGETTGIVPLTRAAVRRAGFALRRLQFAARNHEWDYNDLIVGEDRRQQTEALCVHLSRTMNQWELADLMDVRDVDGAVEELYGAARAAGLHCAVLPADERCPYMTIEGSWENFLSRLPGPSRHRLRQRMSKLRRTLGDEIQLRAVDAPHLEPGLLQRMIALERQKRSGGVVSVPFLGSHADAFEPIWQTLGPKGWLCVTLLEWKDRLLAWQLLFRCGSKLWGYLTAYDHEFAHLSPGGSLIPIAIDYGFTKGMTEFDFLSGEESYKMQWATGFHERKRVLIWNDRWQSKLYAAAYRKMRAKTPAAQSR